MATLISSIFNFCIDMSLSAKMETNRETPLPTPLQIDTDRIVRCKCEALKETGQPRINLLRQYRSIDPARFDTLKLKLCQLLDKVQEGGNPEVEQFMPLILGVLEGTSGSVDPMLLLIEHFGQSIQKIRIEETIKERTKVLYYGVDKRKEMSVRQTDKKTLDSMAILFDTKEIKNHRKICQGIRNYIKAYKKFVKAVDATTEAIDLSSEAYRAYVDFMKEELEFNQLKMPIQDTMVDESEEKPEKTEVTPSKEKPPKKKDDTASTHKIKDKDHQQGEGNNQSEPKERRVRRTKEEVEREKILKQQERQAKKKEKELKEKAKLEQKERQKAEKAEKERQKQLEKQRERKAKQEEKQAKEREKQEAKEAKERQRLQKEAERKRQEEEKQKKSNPGVSLFKFFKPKAENGSPSKQDIMKDEEAEASSETIDESNKKAFLNSILNQTLSMKECRQDFFQNKMKDESSKFEPYYVNIVTHKSRLEFTNFLVTEQRLKDYTEPHGETETGKYEDSSAEYEDLCGDICNQQDLMSAQEEGSEQNSAIVPDSYFQVGELSEESKDDVVVNIDQGGQWYFASPEHQKAYQFEIYCPYEEVLPLTLSEPEQSSELPISMKCDLYREIHGFHGTKDTLIKALAQIADKMPRSYLDNLIKQTSTKKNNQRIVKPEIIEYLNEQRDGFAQELEEIKVRRDEEIKSSARQKVNEKEKEIERLILQEAGTYYIVDLLQFLREKGFKMGKRELSNFIEGRVGPHWDDIRRRMKKMQVKEVEKMNQFLKKDKEPQDEDKSDPKNGAGSNQSDKMQPQ